MFEEAEPVIEEFNKQFELEVVETKQERKRIYWKDVIEQEQRKMEMQNAENQAERLKMDKDKKDENDKVKEISSVNPIADFNRMLSDRKEDLVQTAIEQMEKLIRRLIVTSMNGDLFEKALECLQSMREGCIREDEAESFNSLARHLKKTQVSFFQCMQKANCSLITKHESQLSSIVEQQEANEFI
jgi:ATP-dependent DNA helicase 2 subunit 2